MFGQVEDMVHVADLDSEGAHCLHFSSGHHAGAHAQRFQVQQFCAIIACGNSAAIANKVGGELSYTLINMTDANMTKIMVLLSSLIEGEYSTGDDVGRPLNPTLFRHDEMPVGGGWFTPDNQLITLGLHQPGVSWLPVTSHIQTTNTMPWNKERMPVNDVEYQLQDSPIRIDVVRTTKASKITSHDKRHVRIRNDFCHKIALSIKNQMASTCDKDLLLTLTKFRELFTKSSSSVFTSKPLCYPLVSPVLKTTASVCKMLNQPANFDANITTWYKCLSHTQRFAALIPTQTMSMNEVIRTTARAELAESLTKRHAAKQRMVATGPNKLYKQHHMPQIINYIAPDDDIRIIEHMTADIPIKKSALKTHMQDMKHSRHYAEDHISQLIGILRSTELEEDERTAALMYIGTSSSIQMAATRSFQKLYSKMQEHTDSADMPSLVQYLTERGTQEAFQYQHKRTAQADLDTHNMTQTITNIVQSTPTSTCDAGDLHAFTHLGSAGGLLAYLHERNRMPHLSYTALAILVQLHKSCRQTTVQCDFDLFEDSNDRGGHVANPDDPHDKTAFQLLRRNLCKLCWRIISESCTITDQINEVSYSSSTFLTPHGHTVIFRANNGSCGMQLNMPDPVDLKITHRSTITTATSRQFDAFTTHRDATLVSSMYSIMSDLEALVAA
jgi:hypothetical protein